MEENMTLWMTCALCLVWRHGIIRQRHTSLLLCACEMWNRSRKAFLAIRRSLLLWKPGPVQLGTWICSYVENILCETLRQNRRTEGWLKLKRSVHTTRSGMNGLNIRKKCKSQIGKDQWSGGVSVLRWLEFWTSLGSSILINTYYT